MKTLREFAEDMLNQVTAATGYQGKIVEKIENNEKITVCLSICKTGSMVGPLIKLDGYYEKYKESQSEETLSTMSREIETIACKAWEQGDELSKLGNERVSCGERQDSYAVSERRRKSEPIEEHSVDSVSGSGCNISSEF